MYNILHLCMRCTDPHSCYALIMAASSGGVDQLGCKVCLPIVRENTLLAPCSEL